MNPVSFVLLAFLAVVVGAVALAVFEAVLSPVRRVVDELRAAHPIRRRPKVWDL